ncbi:hypothetical protein [Arthrospiribacter ruber]|uniref:Uncharacterized protein n=1 Tax=Arthrospiribacter ruber TaxID=2487934 RepID=A0A951J1R5_9BACT|nr:hypothetical protein [Arthrospiribacter ruber]MBW3469403.1 hypothetical protein [Arthrospiribacter ruber]
MRLPALILFLVLFSQLAYGQLERATRSSMYVNFGRTGANLREFNEMLDNKGLSPMRKSYSNFGFGYQTRFNDFILGMEVLQNSGPSSLFNGYEIDYRSTRVMLNVGFAFTEEGPFQLIHYMAIGSGALTFQMLRDHQFNSIDRFLQEPQQGYILKDGNTHRSSLNLRGFLTEIGFHTSYDFPIPGRDESLEILARFGYAFSPFEESWDLNGVNFGAAQAGAFFRIGAGITLPDHNFFYRDASIGAHLIYGMHFTTPDALNNNLVENDLEPFSGRPNNWGLKVQGFNRALLYGVDIYNLGLSGPANANMDHTLNSVRVYANAGKILFDMRNFEIGVLGGLGYGNVRYTLNSIRKPDFPSLFEEPDFDGFVRARGLMGKPELMFTYAIPTNRGNFYDVVLGVHGGYELPLTSYSFFDLPMFRYMANPYLQFSVGIRP